MISHRREEKLTAPSRAQRLASFGDIFYQTVRPYQKNNYFYELPDEDYVFSTGYAQLRPLCDGRFLFSSLQRDQFVSCVLEHCTGTSYPAINANDLAALFLAVPIDAEEQRLVGSILKPIDSLITLHQRECGKPPFNQSPAWEQRKLGNCGTTYGGLTGKTKEDFGHGNARFIPYTNVFDNPLTDTKRLGAVEIDSSQNQVAYGDAFFTVSSETPDEVGMSSVWLSNQEDVYLNSFCFGYRQDSTFDPHYLAYMLRSRSVRSNLTLLAQGISRFNISKNKVMELSVPVPSAVEQEQLGQYFTKLDSLITLHQRMCPIFSFCAHGSRTNFAQTLQGWLQILRYPRPIPKMLVSPSAPASGVFGTAKGAFICASSSAGASTSSPSARKNFITSSTLCCRESLSSP